MLLSNISKNGVVSMGRKGFEYDKYIKIALNEAKTPLSGGELKEYVGKHAPGKPLHPQKTFDEALIKMLERGDIKIVGYRPSEDTRNAKQSFKSAPFLFDSSKRLTRPEIQKSVLNMYESEEEYEKVKNIFNKRVKELLNIHQRLWEELKNRTIFMRMDQALEFISAHYGSKKIQEGIPFPEYNMLAKFDPYTSQTIPRYKLSLIHGFWYEYVNVKKIEEEIQSYKDKNYSGLWIYPCTPEEFEDIWISTHILLKEYKVNSYQNVKYITDVFARKPIKFNPGEKWGKTGAIYLEGFEGFNGYPFQRHDLHSFFEKSVDMISTYPSQEMEIILKVLAKSLSEEPNSLLIFHEFFISMTKLDYKERLKNVLGIINKDIGSPNELNSDLERALFEEITEKQIAKSMGVLLRHKLGREKKV